VFVRSICHYHAARAGEVGTALFDKEDNLAVDFVTAAANLRATNFGIKTNTWFDIKGMAGNIIHAIATTNAIISGLIVIEAVKILTGEISKTRDTFCNEFPSGRQKKLLVPCVCNGANPKCYVCSKAVIVVEVDTHKTTLGALIEKVVKKAMGVSEPQLMTEGGFFYEEGVTPTNPLIFNVICNNKCCCYDKRRSYLDHY
jgi:ubiquitin-like 1-activating enzyme E1 B